MDTWMGNNHDPITLHKYLYANADPVTYTDPTGNFSMGGLATSIGISATLNVLSVPAGSSAQDYAIAVAIGTAEGAAFFGVASAAVKVGSTMFKSARAAIYLRQFQQVFKAVTPLGPKIPGFNHLYQSFTLSTRAGKFFISSGTGAGGQVTGALKHISTALANKYPGAVAPEFVEAALIKELDLVITKAAMSGMIKYDKKVFVSTAVAEWELIFGAPKVAGQLPKLYHAIPRNITL